MQKWHKFTLLSLYDIYNKLVPKTMIFTKNMGGGTLSGRMIQSSHRFGLAASWKIWLNPVCRVGCEGSRSEPERSTAER